jgi:hypothetical protein
VASCPPDRLPSRDESRPAVPRARNRSYARTPGRLPKARQNQTRPRRGRRSSDRRSAGAAPGAVETTRGVEDDGSLNLPRSRRLLDPARVSPERSPEDLRPSSGRAGVWPRFGSAASASDDRPNLRLTLRRHAAGRVGQSVREPWRAIRRRAAAAGRTRSKAGSPAQSRRPR